MWANLPPSCPRHELTAEAKAGRPMTSYPPPDDDSQAPPRSEEAVTPRGGFMARPGLKPPPRHAVVVRGGDAPQSEHIPRYRSSIPPPPPPEAEAQPEPGRLAASEKVTLRAVPTPVSSKASAPHLAPMPRVESLPPPSHAPLSDAPYVSSVSESASGSAQRPPRSRWTIVAAAAAGLVLGLASVVVRVYTPGAAQQPSPATTLSTPGVVAPAVTSAAAPKSVSSMAAPPTPPSVTPEAELSSEERKPTRPAPPSAKRTIF